MLPTQPCVRGALDIKKQYMLQTILIFLHRDKLGCEITLNSINTNYISIELPLLWDRVQMRAEYCHTFFKNNYVNVIHQSLLRVAGYDDKLTN